MSTKTNAVIFTVMRIAITSIVIFALTLGVFILLEKFGIAKYNEWNEAKKSIRAWFLLTGIYYAPIFTTCAVLGIIYGKKRTAKSHYEKLAGTVIGGVATLIAVLILIKKITAGVEDADTTVMKYYVMWIVRQMIAFTIISTYQGARAQDNNVTEAMSLDDSDPTPDEVDINIIQDD